jgi:hypothetical protein
MDQNSHNHSPSPKKLGPAQRVLQVNNSPTPKASRLHCFTPSKLKYLIADRDQTPTNNKSFSMEFEAPKYVDFSKVDSPDLADDWFDKRVLSPPQDATKTKIQIDSFDPSPSKISRELNKINRLKPQDCLATESILEFPNEIKSKIAFYEQIMTPAKLVSRYYYSNLIKGQSNLSLLVHAPQANESKLIP